MRYRLWREALDVFGAAPDTKPVVYRDYTDPMIQFDYRAYPKGAWVLHMLRSQLGPDLFRQGIKTYLDRHRGGIVTTDDLQQALEDVSGLSFDQFFDQWVYHGGFPELKVDYSLGCRGQDGQAERAPDAQDRATRSRSSGCRCRSGSPSTAAPSSRARSQ